MPPNVAAHPGASLSSYEFNDAKPYVIVSAIGKGSFATVYKGYHEETRYQVALKAVERTKLSSKLLDNLQSEIQILKSLSHRHITKLIDIVRAETNIYLVMEYCAGGDLTNYIKKRGRVEGLEYSPAPGEPLQYYPHPRTGGLDEIVIRSFLRQLARALKFLRHRNLIHRDIKPQNLLLNLPPAEEIRKGHPVGVPMLKVADFGFARFLPNAMMADTLCGSPLYMAPEILRYQKYDAKADLWSVGAVLYETAVGRPPFRANNHIELLKRIDLSKGVKFPDEDPKHPIRDAPPVPDDIKMLIRTLLKRNPAERASFEEFFNSTALAKSRFKPRQPDPVDNYDVDQNGHLEIPEHHKEIPPEVLDPNVLIPASKFNWRQKSHDDPEPGPSTVRPVAFRERRHARPLSTEGSFIPGETEEDGMLRREYVLVGDTRAVEFNRAVDEINSLPRKPLHDRPTEQEPSSTVTSPISANNITFPPPPNLNAPPLSSSPSRNASRTAARTLHTVIRAAKNKLTGTSHSSPSQKEFSSSTSPPSSPRRPQIITLDSAVERDPLEDALLAELEELAQKTDVLTHWADDMYEAVKAIPQKPLPDPSKFARREGEAEKHAKQRKRADAAAETNAVTCVAVYLLLMSFSQKGIDKLRNFQEHMHMRHPDGDFVVSEGFDDALTWFKDHFIKCNDRAELVKTWLPAQFDGPKAWLDQLVYDRALMLSRTAARKEITDQAGSPDECEKLYEESLWCLYALQDDLLQAGNPFMAEDKETIGTWIKRTKLRLVRCRARMGMTDRERLLDARADLNLNDNRVPAPWDIQSAAPSPTTPAN
ncbi:other/ULK/ULK protein kinase [Coprinopsis marcescibilis]|uniref:non-specific serine/threonine protein kinase n=1 Tax=Coprinopsis marcescibilis TaxID=230819 RepID=A0A5C3LID5_COPMA|nr:other/ULK/ULK protein kinase [Coprinopsis marcescibilis]